MVQMENQERAIQGEMAVVHREGNLIEVVLKLRRVVFHKLTFLRDLNISFVAENN